MASLGYGTKGIRVNTFLPGTTDTAFVRPKGLPNLVRAAFKKAWGPLNVSGLERMAAPEEIARSVVSLATDGFSYLTARRSKSAAGRAGKMHMPPGFPGRVTGPGPRTRRARISSTVPSGVRPEVSSQGPIGRPRSRAAISVGCSPSTTAWSGMEFPYGSEENEEDPGSDKAGVFLVF
ncbi:SDR family oxidoreductase [Amycolatopsis minnesotensis]|uniref:Uncharacterized protein n=1 Tax=Amycolatopsis minnesotensis TaxID=337894 RepID=A0ABP5DBX4_9PSEU